MVVVAVVPVSFLADFNWQAEESERERERAGVQAG